MTMGKTISPHGLYFSSHNIQMLLGCVAYLHKVLNTDLSSGSALTDSFWRDWSLLVYTIHLKALRVLIAENGDVFSFKKLIIWQNITLITLC